MCGVGSGVGVVGGIIKQNSLKSLRKSGYYIYILRLIINFNLLINNNSLRVVICQVIIKQRENKHTLLFYIYEK